MIKVGDNVWVRVGKDDYWVPGRLLEFKGNERRVQVFKSEMVVSQDRISRWGNARLQQRKMRYQPPASLVEPDLTIAHNVIQFNEWLNRVKVEIGISVAVDCGDARQRMAVVAALLPHDSIPDEPAPSWREMALIGDALWLSYLRIVLIREKGYRNGLVETTINEKGWITRDTLAMIGQEMKLCSLLPILRGSPHIGEVVEAFLGWAYTFGGEKAYLQLAQKYLAILEG